MRRINNTQIIIGSAALFLGCLIYLFQRPRDTYFLSLMKLPDTSYHWNPPILNLIGGVLPAFLHVFAISMIIGGLLHCSKRGYLMICCTWFFINALFEFGQKWAISASALIPRFFDNIFVLENMRNYFLKGTFDFLDVFASLLGAGAAYFILVLTLKSGGNDV